MLPEPQLRHVMPGLCVQRALVSGLRFSSLFNGFLSRRNIGFKLVAARNVLVFLLFEAVDRFVHLFRLGRFFLESVRMRR